MTCVAGYIDKNKVYIGGDSFGSTSSTQSEYTTDKIFQYHGQNTENLKIIMGIAGSYKAIDLVQYSDDLFSNYEKRKDIVSYNEKSIINRKFLVKYVVPKLETLSKRINDKFDLMIGIENRLFIIQSDFSVISPYDNYCAIGSGEDFAIGAFNAIEDICLSTDIYISPEDKVIKAVESACKFGTGIGGHIKWIST